MEGRAQQRHLHRVHFIQQGDPHAYSFLDPDDVIRGAHLIPTFIHGQTDNEYNFFYVNMYSNSHNFTCGLMLILFSYGQLRGQGHVYALCWYWHRSQLCCYGT